MPKLSALMTPARVKVVVASVMQTRLFAVVLSSHEGPRPARDRCRRRLAEAQQAYEWTDEKGQVHYGDAQPQDKKVEAKAIDLVPPVSEQDPQKAQERLARDKAYLKKGDAVPASAAKAAEPAPNASSSAPQTCAQQWKAYNESYACLDPYRVGGANNGGQHILPEGYAHCQVLPQPVHCPLANNP